MLLSRMDAYRTDLAYVHDSGHGALARDAAERLVAELASAGHDTGTVVDLGCGSGILASLVSDEGYDVVGIDASPAMVALARTRAPSADVRVESFVTAALPPCVAVAAIGEVLNYTFDSANDEDARAALFERVYDALVPGGVLLFDVATPQRERPGERRRTWAEGVDWVALVEATADTASGVLTRRITTFRQIDDAYRRDDEWHRLSLIDPAATLAGLRAIGFDAQVIPRYGSVPLPTGVAAVLARRPRHTEPSHGRPR